MGMTQEELRLLIDQAANEGWTELDLSGKKLTELPPEIGNLSNLTELSLAINQISIIPEWIGNLSNLTRLNLYRNQISIIPEWIGNLSNLTELSFAINQISIIPEVIGNLSNLTELDLDSNQISVIPEWIGNLSNLIELDLDSNQISVIPEWIDNLSNLTRLKLAGNQISAIPEWIGNLSNLTTLDLSSNQISVIPESIGNLIWLTILDLEQNQVTQIPEALSQLPLLENLDLRGNPIRIPPDILADKKGEEYPNARPILDYYFRTQDPNVTTHFYEAKILIVGEGGSGKTSLARKLLDPDYELPPETADTSTQGIDILRWEFTGRNQQRYRVNIWDFGGQEIYHQTHQFFLTDRALYLLVADSRKEDTDHYFWLQIIRLLSDDSPVLLIQNEKQNRTCNLNLRELRAEFDNLKPPLKTNLADNRGLLEAQTAIQHNLEDLMPQGIPFPNSWLNVRYALENDGRNYIDCADYEAACRYYGITQRTEMFDLSRFLHSLGICLHFQKDPILRHRLILKPNWGTAAVYKILDNPTVKQNFGHFSNADLHQIWQANEYAEMHHELLQLMKAFKVCYEIPQRHGNYIAPHLLSSDQPDYEWDASQNLTLRYRYKGFMPKGILTRFIVEMHKLIENVSSPDQALVWKNGVVLKQGRARAEIIERYHDREIRIRLSGINQRDFLVILHNEFEQILTSYERLEYDTLIPCNCSACKANSKPYSYPLNRLRQFIDQRRPTIQCYESSEDVNVRRLLDDTIEPPLIPEFSNNPLPPGIRPLSGGVPISPGIPEVYRPDFLERHDRSNLTININQHQGANQPVTDQSSKSKTNNFNAPVSTGAIGDGNTVSNNQFNQVNNASTAELLEIIATLRQTAVQFPKEIQDDIIIDIDDIEAEVKKPEAERNPGRLKKRLLALTAAVGMIATPVKEVTDFATKVVTLGEKVGIEIQIPQTPPAP